MSRSFLFVPGDSLRKFERAAAGDADALILDLEDSVSPDIKVAARDTVRQMLETGAPGKQLWVRINPLDTPWSTDDLAAIMPARPFGILQPKTRGGQDVRTLSNRLDALESAHGIESGTTRIIAIATELGAAMFGLGTYGEAGPRLWALTWGAEDLGADLGTVVNRVDGRYTEPFRIARAMTLFAAAAARVRVLDTVCVDLTDSGLIDVESREARRDGFTGKMSIHPKHVAAINAAFTPTEQELEFSRRVVAAFEANPNVGAFRMDGMMIDRPHLRLARRLLGLE
jgi:citrate lyase subunit beta/citryl-CoA lyase